MAFTARRLPNEPIIVVTWSPPIEDPGDEVPRMCREVDRLIGNDKKVWNIQDMREFKVNFSTAVKGMSQVSMDIPGSPRDSRCKNILIGSGVLWDVVAKSAQKMKFGGLDVPIFSSLDEALKHARENGT